MLMGQRFDELTQGDRRTVHSWDEFGEEEAAVSANSVAHDFGLRIFADRMLEPSLRYRLTALCANVKNVLGQMSPGIYRQILVSAVGAGRQAGRSRVRKRLELFKRRIWRSAISR